MRIGHQHGNKGDHVGPTQLPDKLQSSGFFSIMTQCRDQGVPIADLTLLAQRMLPRFPYMSMSLVPMKALRCSPFLNVAMELLPQERGCKSLEFAHA